MNSNHNLSPNPRQLPCAGLYHSRIYSSCQNWLAYQSSMNEVRLVKYDQNLYVNETFVFFSNPQPIKQLKLIHDKRENQLYLGITYLSKFILYRKNQQISTQILKLDRNIVSFMSTFVACDAFDDGHQIYFTFLTCKAQVHVVNVSTPEKKSIVKLSNIDSRVCSIKILGDYTLIGDQSGIVYLVDLNKSSVLKKFDTKSHMPILKIQTLNKRILIPTCQGEILNIAYDLQQFTSVSAHSAMVSHFQVHNDQVYSFGDNGMLNVFMIDKNSKQIQLAMNTFYKKKVNMFIKINHKIFTNFYEQINFQEVK